MVKETKSGDEAQPLETECAMQTIRHTRNKTKAHRREQAQGFDRIRAVI